MANTAVKTIRTRINHYFFAFWAPPPPPPLFCLHAAGKYLSRGPCQLIAECVYVDGPGRAGPGRGRCEARCLPAVRPLKSPSPPSIRDSERCIVLPPARPLPKKKADMTRTSPAICSTSPPPPPPPPPPPAATAALCGPFMMLHVDGDLGISWRWGLGGAGCCWRALCGLVCIEKGRS